jgi:hypothetical protein
VQTERPQSRTSAWFLPLRRAIAAVSPVSKLAGCYLPRRHGGTEKTTDCPQIYTDEHRFQSCGQTEPWRDGRRRHQGGIKWVRPSEMVFTPGPPFFRSRCRHWPTTATTNFPISHAPPFSSPQRVHAGLSFGFSAGCFDFRPSNSGPIQAFLKSRSPIQTLAEGFKEVDRAIRLLDKRFSVE